jgi:4-hydroxybenzoate polyprenyltransferase
VEIINETDICSVPSLGLRPLCIILSSFASDGHANDQMMHIHVLGTSLARNLCRSKLYRPTVRISPSLDIIIAYQPSSLHHAIHIASRPARYTSKASIYPSVFNICFRYASSSSKNDEKAAGEVAALSWIDSSAWIPAYARPYLHLARADKQVGTLLLLWPCCWSVALAAPIGSLPDFFMMVKFGLGAMVMRSAGCIINDLWDKDFDKHVERTKNRPLATGAISVFQAIAFLGSQLSAGLAVLLTFNFNSILLGFSSMPLVLTYPLMKRFTNFPQLLLGLTFNWGALMGWTAVHGSISLVHVLPIYIAGVCWTLIYDTLYAYQDRKDDLKLGKPKLALSLFGLVDDLMMMAFDAGLKSTSLYLGDKPQIPLTAIATCSVLSLSAAGYLTQLTLPFYIGVSGIGSHLLWQIWTADVNDSKNLWSRFNSNKYLGGAVTAIIILGHF